MPLTTCAELPSEIDGVLHAGVEALPAHGVMDMRSIAGEQHPSLAVATPPAALVSVKREIQDGLWSP